VRILLDECVPWPLSKLLPDHQCLSPQKCGWGGVKNGDLLRLAEAEFDLFITSDQNLRYQQNLKCRKIAIIELSTNDWHIIRSHAEAIRALVKSMKAGAFVQHSLHPL
jgi:hypothetical protein